MAQAKTQGTEEGQAAAADANNEETKDVAKTGL